VKIYTDGACDPNPGTGGWAAILVAASGTKKELSGAERDSTNNRMELTGAIKALEALKSPCTVELYTDSEYLKKAFTDGWLIKWQRNGWRNAQKKPVANKDLWEELLTLSQTHEITWHWVRGHASNPMNNRCDELAVAAREKLARG
jgi:ribonuclease HI